MFKEIKAIFRVTRDVEFETNKWKKDRCDWIIEVKRYKSGAFEYGDKSGHSIIIKNHPEYIGENYDTRYHGISTDKEEWLAMWKEHIESYYSLEIKLLSYEEYMKMENAEINTILEYLDYRYASTSLNQFKDAIILLQADLKAKKVANN